MISSTTQSLKIVSSLRTLAVGWDLFLFFFEHHEGLTAFENKFKSKHSSQRVLCFALDVIYGDSISELPFEANDSPTLSMLMLPNDITEPFEYFASMMFHGFHSRLIYFWEISSLDAISKGQPPIDGSICKLCNCTIGPFTTLLFSQ